MKSSQSLLTLSHGGPAATSRRPGAIVFFGLFPYFVHLAVVRGLGAGHLPPTEQKKKTCCRKAHQVLTLGALDLLRSPLPKDE